MFWKKKQDSEELFTYESCDYRSAYRHYPPESDPLFIEVGEQKANIIDIGAGGISFQNTLDVKVGDIISGKVDLNFKTYVIEPEMKVLRISDEGFVHCSFTKISLGEEESVHRYILEKQKEALRQKRNEM